MYFDTVQRCGEGGCDDSDDEIATYAKLLVSDAGDMLAGETIHISGGRGVWDIR